MTVRRDYVEIGSGVRCEFCTEGLGGREAVRTDDEVFCDSMCFEEWNADRLRRDGLAKSAEGAP